MQRRILVVDDDPNIIKVIQRGLSFEGFQVLVANSGEQALAVARDGDPDLIILDLMLPGLDGLEVCKRLRGAINTPILMLTARDQVRDKIAGLEAGADDYLPKPFVFDELLARVRALLRRAKRKALSCSRWRTWWSTRQRARSREVNGLSS